MTDLELTYQDLADEIAIGSVTEGDLKEIGRAHV